MNQRIGQSVFWDLLWQYYSSSPSIVLCRVPELEYAAKLDITGKVLDHGCGDGIFASLAWPGCKLTAGCDINKNAIKKANQRGIYTRLDICDASQRLPYEDNTFDLVFNNSALEHIEDLKSTLLEVSRVLSPNGVFAFNVLNHRYFEWWPLNEESKKSYRAWQPFYHALSLAEWKLYLAAVGLQVDSVEGYFDRKASQGLARLDYAFSGVYLAQKHSRLVKWYKRFPSLMIRYWHWRLSSLTWQTKPDSGAGYFIKAIQTNV